MRDYGERADDKGMKRMDKRKLRSKRPSDEWLYQEYIVKRREGKDIAAELGVHVNTVQKWTSEAGFKKERGKYLDTKPTDDELYTDYILDHLPMKEMIEKYQAPESTIKNWISDAELSRSTNQRITSVEALGMLKEYESDSSISIRYLSKKHSVSMSRVYRLLKRGREIKAELEKKGMVKV